MGVYSLLHIFLFSYISEHQELSKEINETSDLRIREDLERELDALVSRMEAKSQQIAKIRKHQEKVYICSNFGNAKITFL